VLCVDVVAECDTYVGELETWERGVRRTVRLPQQQQKSASDNNKQYHNEREAGQRERTRT
jgi:hypothetical protein